MPKGNKYCSSLKVGYWSSLRAAAQLFVRCKWNGTDKGLSRWYKLNTSAETIDIQDDGFRTKHSLGLDSFNAAINHPQRWTPTPDQVSTFGPSSSNEQGSTPPTDTKDEELSTTAKTGKGNTILRQSGFRCRNI